MASSSSGNTKKDGSSSLDEENNTNNKKKTDEGSKHSFFRLFSFATPLDFGLICLGIITSAAAGTPLLLFVVLFGNSIDEFNNGIDLHALYSHVCELALKMTYVGVGAFVAHSVSRLCWAYSSERQIEAMRIAFLKSILRQEISYFDITGTGTLTSQMVSNTLSMQGAIGEKLGQLLQYISTFVTGIIIGFVFSWKLTLVVLTALPPMIVVGGAISIIFQQAEVQAQKAYGRAGNVANEMIAGMRTVHSFNLHEIAMKKYTERIAQAMTIGIRKGFFVGASIGAAYLIFFGWYSLTFWYGGKLHVDDNVSGGNILTVIMSVMIASFVLGTGASNAETLAKGHGAAASFFDVLDRKPVIDNYSPDGKKLPTYDGNLCLKDVHFRYPSRPEQKILHGVNLNIPTGAKVALVGPSGSGKSSIIQLLQRFYDPEEGSVSLNGHDLKELNVSWLRSQFGIVGQEPALFSGTIAENIEFGCLEQVSHEEIIQAAKLALAHDFIQSFPLGYDTQVGERGAQLSGGQKQRIAIARAILKNPKILLLDEATSALDSRSEQKVQQALDSASKGRTTITIAHRLSTIKNADVIAVIDRGVLVEQGTHLELLKLGGVYSNLVRIQLGTHDEHNEEQRGPVSEDDDLINVIVQKNEVREDAVALNKFSLTQILTMSRPEFPQLLFGSLGSIAIGVINPLQSLFFAKIFAAYYLPDNEVIGHLRPYLLVYVGLAVGMQLAYIVQGYYFGYAGQKLVYRCRQKSFKSIMRQEIGWFDKKQNSTGALTGKLSLEAGLVENAVGAPLGAVVTCLTAVITGLVIAFANSWRLAWVLTLSFPFVLLGGFAEIYSMMASDSAKQAALLSANVVATEAISNIRTVASYVKEGKMVNRYSVELLKPKETAVKSAVFLGLLTGIGQFGVMASNALAFWYGGKLIRDQQIGFEAFLIVYQAFMFASESVSVTLGTSGNFTKARPAAAAIFALINRIPQIDSLSENGSQPPHSSISGEVKFEGVHFAYTTRPNTQVLRGLDLMIRPNRVTALVGASGCGKSSCIGLIERWYEPNQGIIKLDGIDIREYNTRWLRNIVALVGQEPVLFSGTIADNIGQAVDNATLDDIEAAAKSANAHNFIIQFPDGYRTQVGEKGAQLSGGQKQRIAIARAIIKRPSILLLDEATSALDTESEEVVQQALDNVMQGLTTVVIAHRLSTIRRANHIAVIDEGVVVEQGTHEELMSLRKKYFRLVEAQT